ncbi:MAG TPA: amidohydrolase family protein [Vicinamibacterales bacterium]|nr:amidohydrolase family protein [Vicinamibacterales bacterium]
MIRYHAAWIVPIEGEPIRDAWMTVDHGRIVALGRRAANDTTPGLDLGDVAIMPGLVNAHTHLELSYLRDRIAPAPYFTGWVRQILHARRERMQQPLREPGVMEAIDAAIDESVRSGTAVVGEITNTLFLTFEKIAHSPLAGVVFWELLGFNLPDANFDELVAHAVSDLNDLPATENVRPSLAAHAPYSVAPLFFRAIKQAVSRMPFAPCSVHLAEGAEEIELLMTGGGPWKTIMTDIGAWNHAWTAPGVGPVQYLDDMGFLDSRLLAVHGVQMSAEDLEKLRARGVTLVTCPRSNGHTGAGLPPIADFYKSGIRVAIGTDSLASAPDLNVFAEVATLHALAPSVPPASLLESATIQGARALGFDADYGSIEPGKLARVLAVDVPPGTTDVEEYLVSGIHPGQIRWL